MWLFTTRGFFSIVQDKNDSDRLWVRARIRGDLEQLRKLHPALGPTLQWPNRDYRFRAALARETYAGLLVKLAEELTYKNFKDAVAKKQGTERAHLYHDVWGVMYDAQETQARNEGAQE